MSPTETCFIEPLDVLYLRGNKLFGDRGSYGEALIPPWPSVAAGALRSRILADGGIDLTRFARSEIEHLTLGTPECPGSFTVQAFHLARRLNDGAIEPLFAPPADLVLSRDAADQFQARALTPTPLPTGEGLKPSGIQSSAPLPRLPVLAENQRSKPESGYWLTLEGWETYLKGGSLSIQNDDQRFWVKVGSLWAIDHRVGVGLDADKRSAAEGRLFSMQAVAMRSGIGFLARVAGAALPKAGTLRFGGDGRAAALSSVEMGWPEPDYAAIADARRCRLVLTTPGLFGSPLPAGEGSGVRGGWLPTGISQTPDGSYRFNLHGIQGRLVCAAVPRSEVVSGWDIANWKPKPAQRAVPTGSVYWLDDLEATPEALRALVERGLWSAPCEDDSRRAEGFNRLSLAFWPLP